MGPRLNQDKNPKTSAKSKDALVHEDTFGVVEGSVKTRGKSSGELCRKRHECGCWVAFSDVFLGLIQQAVNGVGCKLFLDQDGDTIVSQRRKGVLCAECGPVFRCGEFNPFVRVA